MRTRTRWPGGTALAISLVSSLLVTASCSGPGASTRPAADTGGAHRQVDTGLDTCAGCHAQATPKVVTAWSDGRHGLTLVECVVCHGSTGADFKARPATGACSGCHAVQTAALAAQPGSACFSCHPAHALHAASGQQMPHPAKPKEAGR
jgi:hypothetical protein